MTNQEWLNLLEAEERKKRELLKLQQRFREEHAEEELWWSIQGPPLTEDRIKELGEEDWAREQGGEAFIRKLIQDFTEIMERPEFKEQFEKLQQRKPYYKTAEEIQIIVQTLKEIAKRKAELEQTDRQATQASEAGGRPDGAPSEFVGEVTGQETTVADSTYEASRLKADQSFDLRFKYWLQKLVKEANRKGAVSRDRPVDKSWEFSQWLNELCCNYAKTEIRLFTDLLLRRGLERSQVVSELERHGKDTLDEILKTKWERGKEAILTHFQIAPSAQMDETFKKGLKIIIDEFLQEEMQPWIWSSESYKLAAAPALEDGSKPASLSISKPPPDDPENFLTDSARKRFRAALLRIHAEKADRYKNLSPAEYEICEEHGTHGFETSWTEGYLQKIYDLCVEMLDASGVPLTEDLVRTTIPVWVFGTARKEKLIRTDLIPGTHPSRRRRYAEHELTESLGGCKLPTGYTERFLEILESKIFHWWAVVLEREAAVGSKGPRPSIGNLPVSPNVGAICEELPPDAQAQISTTLEQFDHDLMEAAGKIDAESGEKRTLVYQLVRRWLDRTIDAIAGEWVRVGLDVREFSRQMDRIEAALLEKGKAKYATYCWLSGDRATSSLELLRSQEGNLRSILTVRGRGWRRRNNERLLLVTKERGRIIPILSKSADAELRGTGDQVMGSLEGLGDLPSAKPNAEQPADRATGNRPDQVDIGRTSAPEMEEKGGTRKKILRRWGPQPIDDYDEFAKRRGAIRQDEAAKMLGRSKKHIQNLVRQQRLTQTQKHLILIDEKFKAEHAAYFKAATK